MISVSAGDLTLLKFENVPVASGMALLAVADAVQSSRTLPNEALALTLTSPPYDHMRDYGGYARIAIGQVNALARELFRATKDGGVVVWIVSDQTLNGGETGTSFRHAQAFMKAGFKLADTMIYQKANPGGARGSPALYTQAFEYMFVLCKGCLPQRDLLKDRPNARPGVYRGGGGRRSDDAAKATRTIVTLEFGKRSNIWTYSRDSETFGHPAPFPLALAEDHVRSWSDAGDWVYDPFLGSGTTMVAALRHGRNAIGSDINPAYVEISRSRLQSEDFRAVA